MLKSVNASRHIGLWILLIYILLHSAGRSKKKDKCKNTQMYPLSETQYCPCDKYNAQPVGNWSDCILPEGGRVESILGMKVQGDIKECGQGYRYQAMVCYDQDNRLVETSRCNSHGGYACMCVCQECSPRACSFCKGKPRKMCSTDYINNSLLAHILISCWTVCYTLTRQT